MFGWIRDLLEAIGLLPVHALAVLLGLLLTWGVTQAAKQWLGWHGKRAAALAFVNGFATTFLVVQPAPLVPPGYFWAHIALAAAVGLLAPTIYKVAMVIIRKRWPDVAAALSGDAGRGAK